MSMCCICIVGVANGTSKLLGLVNFSCDVEISAAFAKSLEVSLKVHVWSRSRIFKQSSRRLVSCVSASRRVSDFTIRHPL